MCILRTGRRIVTATYYINRHQDIQEIMGHADISTTMDVYAEATQEKKKESMTSLQSALLVR